MQKESQKCWKHYSGLGQAKELIQEPFTKYLPDQKRQNIRIPDTVKSNINPAEEGTLYMFSEEQRRVPV